MEVLVTGITGFIGIHLASTLLREGHRVTGLLRDSSRSIASRLPSSILTHPNFDYTFADLRNLRKTSQAIREIQPGSVIHLAAVGTTDPYLPLNSAIRNNVYGTLNLLQACFQSSDIPRPEKVVVARTPGEREPVNTYSASKAAAWNFCKMYARVYSWSIFGAMIFQAYGPGQPQNALIPSAFEAATNNQDFPMTSGRQMRDWIYVDDVVSGLIALIESSMPTGTSIEIGTGTPTSTAAVVREIFQLTGSSGKPLIGVLSDRPGEEFIQIAAAEMTKELTGWRSMISLKDGLPLYLSESIEQT